MKDINIFENTFQLFESPYQKAAISCPAISMVQVLGIESLSGVAKCEKVTEICITAFQNAEDKKIADSFDALKRKRVTSTSQPALSSSNVTICCDPKQPNINAALAERSKAEVE